MAAADDALKPEKNLGEEDKDKTDSIMPSDEENEEQDFILDQEDQDFHYSETSSDEDTDREWLWVKLNEKKGADEQIAFLEDVLKYDKSGVQSMHEYSSISEFYALMNKREAAKLSGSDIVSIVRPGRPPRIREELKKIRRNEIKRKVDARQKTKKQKVSMEANGREASKPVYSNYDPYLPPDDAYRCWYEVGIKTNKQRDEQKAFLLDVLNLKCDKSEVRFFHEFIRLSAFNAYLTAEEAHKLSKLKIVHFVEPRFPKRPKRKINAQQNFKEQTQSIGIRLSEARKNKEKWRYDEGLETDFATNKTGDYYCSSYYDEHFEEEYEYYDSLDAAGKRRYTVNLVNDMHADDQIALLLDTLNRSVSEIDDIYMKVMKRYHHCFSAYLTEEEADEVAGLEEVEYVEPHRYVLTWL